MAGELHISISAERVFSFGPVNISNSILTSLIVSTLLILFFLAVRATLNKKTKEISPLQNIAEFLVQGCYGMVQGVTGDHKKTRFFLPFFLSFFLFILLNNWIGLIPGVGTIGFRETPTGTEQAVLLQHEIKVPVARAQAAEETNNTSAVTEPSTEEKPEEKPIFVPYFRAGTADLNTTLALAVFTMTMVQVMGVKYLGLAYFKKFFNFKNPILFFVSVLETISEVAKILSFSFRLFGNIFAGEVLLVVVGSLIPLIAPMPFYGLEVFVGLIQALVFSLLSIVFFNVATVSHDEHEN